METQVTEFNFLELFTHTFFRCAKSILVLHMALFEVALGSRLKNKKNPPRLIRSEEHSPVGLKAALDFLPLHPSCGMVFS